MTIYLTKDITDALINNDYNLLNKIGIISVPDNGLTKEQWERFCHLEAVEFFASEKFVPTSSNNADMYFNLKTDVLRKPNNFAAYNLVGLGAIISNSGYVINDRGEEEKVTEWDTSKESILRDICIRLTDEHFQYKPFDKLDRFDFIACSKRLDFENHYICINTFIEDKLDLASDCLKYDTGERIYFDLFDEMFFSGAIETSYINTFDKNGKELLIAENSGNILILDIEEGYVEQFYEGEDFCYQFFKGTAETGILKSIEMSIHGTVEIKSFHAKQEEEDDDDDDDDD